MLFNTTKDEVKPGSSQLKAWLTYAGKNPQFYQSVVFP